MDQNVSGMNFEGGENSGPSGPVSCTGTEMDHLPLPFSAGPVRALEFQMGPHLTGVSPNNIRAVLIEASDPILRSTIVERIPGGAFRLTFASNLTSKAYAELDSIFLRKQGIVPTLVSEVEFRQKKSQSSAVRFRGLLGGFPPNADVEEIKVWSGLRNAQVWRVQTTPFSSTVFLSGVGSFTTIPTIFTPVSEPNAAYDIFVPAVEKRSKCSPEECIRDIRTDCWTAEQLAAHLTANGLHPRLIFPSHVDHLTGRWENTYAVIIPRLEADMFERIRGKKIPLPSVQLKPSCGPL